MPLTMLAPSRMHHVQKTFIIEEVYSFFWEKIFSSEFWPVSFKRNHHEIIVIMPSTEKKYL